MQRLITLKKDVLPKMNSNQYCFKGHDTLIKGRTKTRNCRMCKTEYSLKRSKEIYLGQRVVKYQGTLCLRGHNKSMHGRRPNGYCIICHRLNMKKVMWKKRSILNANGSQFSLLDFDRAYQVQQGKCKMCGYHQSRLSGPLCADHDHETGKFRGLLCNECNKTLGVYQNVKESAEKYLGEI